MTQRKNPWNGLRTYIEGEVIYGRTAEIRDLCMLILQGQQTVIYGRSGIGKSSILAAGIFPEMRRRGIFPVFVRLDHHSDTPYTTQVRDIIAREAQARGITAETVVETGDDATLWEFFHSVEYRDSGGQPVRPLVVFDQFEEIFTLQADHAKMRGFFSQMADLINDVMPEALRESSTPPPIGDVGGDGDLDLGLDTFSTDAYRYKTTADYHLVFTLREDFLSYLERNTTSIPALKNNRYCLQPITPAQAMEIITSPRPGLVSDDVARLIIRKVTKTDGDAQTGEVDSAILSLYLSRLYDKMVAEGLTTINEGLVNAHSDNIIDEFYRDAVAGIPKQQVEWLEDVLINENGRRDNRSRATVLSRSGLTEENLDVLVNRKKLLREFQYGDDLRIEYIHDVLCPVVVRRKAQRRQLAQARRLRNRIIRTSVFVALVALALGTFMYSRYYKYSKTFTEAYPAFTLEAGWPVGVGEPLSPEQQKRTPLYYKLIKRGSTSPHYTRVEICSSNSMLPDKDRLDFPEATEMAGDAEGANITRLLNAAEFLTFVPNEEGKIARMEVWHGEGDLRLIYNYFHSDGGAWVTYIEPSGKSLLLRDNLVDRSRLEWDTLGRVASQRFFTANGNSMPIDTLMNVSGYAFEYPDSRTTRKYLLDYYGQPVREPAYNLIEDYRNGDTAQTAYYKVKAFDDAQPERSENRQGYHKIQKIGDVECLYTARREKPVAICRQKTDGKGNLTEQIIEGYNANVAPLTYWKYKGNTGLVTERRRLTAYGNPYGENEDVYLDLYDYDDDGNLIMERRQTVDGKTVYDFSLTTTDNGRERVTRRKVLDRRQRLDYTRIDTVRNDRTYRSTTFEGIDGAVEFGSDLLLCHARRVHIQGNRTVSEYYTLENGHAKPIATRIYDDGRAMAFRRTVTEKGDRRIIELTDARGNIVRRMVEILQNGQLVARAAASVIDDGPVRCPVWEEQGYGYYLMYFAKDFNGNFVTMQAYDEFGQPSPIYDGKKCIKTEYLDYKGKTTTDHLPILNHYRQTRISEDTEAQPVMVPYLHLLSKESSLYRNAATRVHDGDIIVALGNWHLGQPETMLAAEWKRLSRKGEKIPLSLISAAGLIDKTAGSRQITIDGDPSETTRSHYHILPMSPCLARQFEPLLKSYGIEPAN